MIFRALDSNSDWTFGKGKQNYLRDLDAITLNLITRLNQWKGDCYYSPAEGVDYNNFLDKGTKVFLDRDIKRVILQSEGILKINSFESVLSSDIRELEIETSINTIYGDTIVQEVL